MTKSIRIENADTSDHKVCVEVWDKQIGSESMPDTLVETHFLHLPTAMLTTYIWNSRYLVIREM